MNFKALALTAILATGAALAAPAQAAPQMMNTTCRMEDKAYNFTPPARACTVFHTDAARQVDGKGYPSQLTVEAPNGFRNNFIYQGVANLYTDRDGSTWTLKHQPTYTELQEAGTQHKIFLPAILR